MTIKKAVLSTFICLGFLFIYLNCVATPPTVAVDEVLSELLGTWVNYEYDPPAETESPAKRIVNADGSVLDFGISSFTQPTRVGQISIAEGWFDKEGNLWFKSVLEFDELTSGCYMINKISDSGAAWETVWQFYEYPKEFNPMFYSDWIYYRQ
jgi:hypothetical protein